MKSFRDKIYTGCIKKIEQIWNSSQFRKTARGMKFLLNIDSLSTHNVK
jgi:hypothetical protein